jgi:hypothetical protein
LYSSALQYLSFYIPSSFSILHVLFEVLLTKICIIVSISFTMPVGPCVTFWEVLNKFRENFLTASFNSTVCALHYYLKYNQVCARYIRTYMRFCVYFACNLLTRWQQMY